MPWKMDESWANFAQNLNESSQHSIVKILSRFISFMTKIFRFTWMNISYLAPLTLALLKNIRLVWKLAMVEHSSSITVGVSDEQKTF
jgi:hypothetical protein